MKEKEVTTYIPCWKLMLFQNKCSTFSADFFESGNQNNLWSDYSAARTLNNSNVENQFQNACCKLILTSNPAFVSYLNNQLMFCTGIRWVAFPTCSLLTQSIVFNCAGANCPTSKFSCCPESSWLNLSHQNIEFTALRQVC